jgi:small subunit ribosomal protein S16|uniref:30S ribosomal protein S16 n=1 Tax=Ochromonas sp. CCMP1393 TaxID=420556 RepID=A0A0D3ML29_9STRA|nr:30S ribosomal protein S16 [Ochromonas sp. CCMP1393]|mmetsp:Transcript_17228/g.28910  ORF Transcript_17228/g.28910 Transcript_17228/m.28910 type:complete len:83 (-) Transcript_17228:3-251(-)
MLKIRLKRTGRKSKPFYRIVLMENLSRRDGKSIAEIGYYDPLTKIINFDNIKLHKYLNHGAYPTNTVRHLIYKMLENQSSTY